MPERDLDLDKCCSPFTTIMTGDLETPPARVFRPLYKSSGDSASDRLAFFHILEQLKVRSLIQLLGVVPAR